MDLTFAEQVKIILSRRGMTIKELAELIEEAYRKENVPSEFDTEIRTTIFKSRICV